MQVQMAFRLLQQFLQLPTHLWHTQIVHWYLLGGANVHSHLTHDALNPPECTHQEPFCSVRPFLHGS